MRQQGKWSSYLTGLRKAWSPPKGKSSSATPFCKICFKPLSYRSIGEVAFGQTEVCSRCYETFEAHLQTWKIGQIKASALYDYNEAIRSLLYQFKGAGDLALKDVFLANQLPFLKLRYHGFVVVPAPSSKSHNEKRGFNQVEEMFSCLGLPMKRVLTKTKESKQSDLSAEERKQVGKILSMQENGELRGKRVLLVDDVYTTGSTCKACLKLLLKARPKSLEVLVMAKVKGPSTG